MNIQNMSKQQLEDNINILSFQIERLKENAFFIEYQKIKPILSIGRNTEAEIIRLSNLRDKLVNIAKTNIERPQEQLPRYEDEAYERPRPKIQHRVVNPVEDDESLEIPRPPKSMSNKYQEEIDEDEEEARKEEEKLKETENPPEVNGELEGLPDLPDDYLDGE